MPAIDRSTNDSPSMLRNEHLVNNMRLRLIYMLAIDRSE